MFFHRRYFFLLVTGLVFLGLGCSGTDPPDQKITSSYSQSVTSTSFNFQFISPWQVMLSWKDNGVGHYVYRKSCLDCEADGIFKVSADLNYFIDTAGLSYGFLRNCWEVKDEDDDFLGQACLTMGPDITFVYVTQWNSKGVTSGTRMYNLLELIGYGDDSFLIDRRIPAGNPSPITATINENGVALFFPRIISPPSFIPEYFITSFDYPETAKAFPFATTLEIMRCNYKISDCSKNKDFEVIDYITTSESYLDPVTGGSYCYRVLAMNIYGSSGPSNTVCVNVDEKKLLKASTSIV